MKASHRMGLPPHLSDKQRVIERGGYWLARAASLELELKTRPPASLFDLRALKRELLTAKANHAKWSSQMSRVKAT